MASIIERRNRAGDLIGYQAHIVRKGCPRQVRTFRSWRDAEVWAATVESEIGRGTWRPTAEAEATTLAEALDRYAAEVIPSKKSQRPEYGIVKRFSRHPLGRRSLASLRGRDVAAYIRDRVAGGAGANTVRLDLALLSHLYTVARSAWGMESLVNPVPLAKTARPRLPPGRDRRLRPGEEDRLLASASAAFRPVIRCALATAMRRGEIAAMQWVHVDLARRSVHLPVTKNGQARTVPLSQVAVAIIESLPRRLDGLVFGMSGNAIGLAWKRTRAAAGVDDLRFHDLRHEAISRLFEDTDLDAMEIARISGHRTLSMLSRYTHLRTHRLAERLDGAPRARRGG